MGTDRQHIGQSKGGKRDKGTETQIERRNGRQNIDFMVEENTNDRGNDHELFHIPSLSSPLLFSSPLLILLDVIVSQSISIIRISLIRDRIQPRLVNEDSWRCTATHTPLQSSKSRSRPQSLTHHVTASSTLPSPMRDSDILAAAAELHGSSRRALVNARTACSTMEKRREE